MTNTPEAERDTAPHPGTSLKMADTGSHVTEKIWSLAMEILSLLSGEAPLCQKSGDHVTLMVTPPPSSLMPERRCLRKILELSTKISELLTEEADNVKRELVKEESAQGEVGCEIFNVIKVELSAHPATTQTSPYHYVEEMDDERNVEEKFCPLIDADGRHVGRNSQTYPDIITDFKKEEEEVVLTHSPAGNPISQSLHPSLPDADVSSDASNIVWPVPGDSNPTPPYMLHSGEETTSHQTNPAGEKPYSCSECGKGFSRNSYRLKHERTHTIKLFSCQECGKCFSQESELLKHERTHTEERPYACPVCDRRFSRISSLVIHERTHNGVKPYSCSECGKGFSQLSTLLKHQRYHTGEKPFTCTICGKGFSQASDRIKHERIHTGERPYSCSLCGKSFSQISTLNTHSKYHIGVKPYSCSICGKCFVEKSHVIRHEKIHFAKKP